MENDIYLYLGKRIAIIRKEKKLKQADLAQMIGASQKSLSHWENGYAHVSIDLLLKITTALNITMQDLFPAEVQLASFLSAEEVAVLAAYRNDERVRRVIDALIHEKKE